MEKLEIIHKMIDRGVDLWCKKLFTPEFNNGDETIQGNMCEILATETIMSVKSKIPDLENRVEKFRKELTDILRESISEYGFHAYLRVDYHSCQELAEAATKAEIPLCLLSVKSSVEIYEDHVSSSFGYGSPYINHFPLLDGRWLLTDLRGKLDGDFQKILQHVHDGNSLGFTVE